MLERPIDNAASHTNYLLGVEKEKNLKRDTERKIATSISLTGVLIVAWLGGMDFSERSIGLGFTSAAAIIISAWQWAAPWWRD